MSSILPMLRSCLVTSCALLTLGSGLAAQITYYVDDTLPGDDGNNGGSGDPWKTITWAVTQVADGDTIIVRPGTYDVGANGETFPIAVPDGVHILGEQTDEAQWPRIGGDLGTVRAVLEMVAGPASGDVDGSRIERLYFLANSIAGAHAPPAVQILVASGYLMTDSGISECTFERSAMNGTGLGNPVIFVKCGETPLSEIDIEDCTINATKRGGIEIRPGNTALGPVALFKVTVTNCLLQVTGADNALFGIYAGGKYVSSEARLRVSVDDCVIDSTNVTNPALHGFLTGVDFHMDAADGKDYRFSGPDTRVTDSEIMGCRGDAVRMRIDSDESYGSETDGVIKLDRNYIHDNGWSPRANSVGAGVHLAFNDTGAHGYISIVTESNMIVENLYGYYYDGFDADTAGQAGAHINDTIASNRKEGLYLEGVFTAGMVPAPGILSCIVWGNNSGGSQHGGSAGFDPCVHGGMRNSCWQGLFAPMETTCVVGANDNTDADPMFGGSSGYHLTNLSTAQLDKGDDGAVSSAFDFEGDDRKIDAGVGPGLVDMGADEHDP
jgi:hypothetical protein